MLKTSLIKFLFVAATQLKDFPSAKQELSGNLCMMEMFTYFTDEDDDDEA